LIAMDVAYDTSMNALILDVNSGLGPACGWPLLMLWNSLLAALYFSCRIRQACGRRGEARGEGKELAV
jgi:hypothetical protein